MPKPRLYPNKEKDRAASARAARSDLSGLWRFDRFRYFLRV
jgi:hypothetical protein